MIDTSTKPGQTARPALRAKARYRFDNALARGPVVVIGYLGLLFLVVIVVVALIATVAGLWAGSNLVEAFWQSVLRTVDPGAADDQGWPTRVFGLAVTVTGILLGGALIGLLANGVDQKVDELRQGRSRVLESGHTMILGWSPRVMPLVSELVVANESEKRASIVILGREDKTVMEEALRAAVPDFRTTRVVCRSGSPSDPDDLERAAIAGARSIIVVPDEDGEAGVVKAVLAARSLDRDLARAHIVAEVTDPTTTRIIRALTNGRVLTVSSDQVVAEVTAQACLQRGMSAVFTELLDFDGDEMYFVRVPELAGHTYREALLAFEKSSLIGWKPADGKVQLNPPSESVFGPQDQVIVVAEDDSKVAFKGFRAVDPPTPAMSGHSRRQAVRIVIFGWSSFGAMVLKELDEFLTPGSNVEVVADRNLVDTEAMQSLTLRNATLEIRLGDGGPEAFRALYEGPRPTQVIVLGYRDALSINNADARTLLTLLAMRSVWPVVAGADHVRVVGELLDQRNLPLADPGGVDDLIVSGALASLLMAQLSERAEMDAVFQDLFDAEGAILEMRPAPELVAAESMPYELVVAAGGAIRTSVVGYRLGATGTVILNPPKSDPVTLGPDDQVVMISTNSTPSAG